MTLRPGKGGRIAATPARPRLGRAGRLPGAHRADGEARSSGRRSPGAAAARPGPTGGDPRRGAASPGGMGRPARQPHHRATPAGGRGGGQAQTRPYAIEAGVAGPTGRGGAGRSPHHRLEDRAPARPLRRRRREIGGVRSPIPKWRPVRDSNPCCQRERLESWASRRTGRRAHRTRQEGVAGRPGRSGPFHSLLRRPGLAHLPARRDRRVPRDVPGVDAPALAPSRATPP